MQLQDLSPEKQFVHTQFISNIKTLDERGIQALFETLLELTLAQESVMQSMGHAPQQTAASLLIKIHGGSNEDR